jgi:hypothetical protein
MVGGDERIRSVVPFAKDREAGALAKEETAAPPPQS